MNLKVGDLVTAYWKGYFRVVAIQNMCKPLDMNAQLQAVPEGHTNAGEIIYQIISVQQEYDTKGNFRRSKDVKNCHGSFCQLAKDVLPAICSDLNSTRNRLLDIYDKL